MSNATQKPATAKAVGAGSSSSTEVKKSTNLSGLPVQKQDPVVAQTEGLFDANAQVVHPTGNDGP